MPQVTENYQHNSKINCHKHSNKTKQKNNNDVTTGMVLQIIFNKKLFENYYCFIVI